MRETTSIKIHRATKAKLDRARARNETYDRLLDRLVTQPADVNRDRLVRDYQRGAALDRSFAAEWEQVDDAWSP